MNNNIENTAAKNTNTTANVEVNSVSQSEPKVTEWAYISEWMKADVATDWIQSLITEGTYQKGQIKKGSPRFANKKDKSEGYEVRVIAVSGLHPELEKAVVGYRKEIEKKVRPSAAPLKPWKGLLNVDNIAVDEEGNLRVTDKCIWLADGRRIQIFTNNK